jgi:hypothetical protein
MNSGKDRVWLGARLAPDRAILTTVYLGYRFFKHCMPPDYFASADLYLAS